MNYIRTGISTARQELKSSMFDPSEPSLSDNLLQSASTPRIDIVKTFSPTPRYATIPAKLFLLIWVLVLLGLSISQSGIPSFWAAYLTHWGWTFTCAYFVSSFVTALYLMKFDQDARAAEILVKITWALFAIVLPAEIVLTALYWILLYSGGASYIDIMLHGVGSLLLIADGNIINRIPLRMKQTILFEALAFAYVVWSLIFSYSDLTNPWQEAGYQDDDAIYPPLRWKTNTSMVIVLCVILMCVVNPIVFLICRWISRLLPKRLAEVEEKTGDVELAETGS